MNGKPNNQQRCEICGYTVRDDDGSLAKAGLAMMLCGCEKCGRMFGPCCNSVEDSLCVECV